jgi:hypothetical protein
MLASKPAARLGNPAPDDLKDMAATKDELWTVDLRTKRSRETDFHANDRRVFSRFSTFEAVQEANQSFT